MGRRLPGRLQGIKKLIKESIPKRSDFRAREVHQSLPEWAQEKVSVNSLSKIMKYYLPVEQVDKDKQGRIWRWRGRIETT
jgi:hypothetical protein